MTCESALSSPAAADSTWASNGSGSRSPGAASPTSPAVESSIGNGQTSLSSQMWARSTSDSPPSTASSEDSPVRISATPGEERASTASAPPSGSRWLAAFAYFDPASSSWRTCQASLLADSGESCTTWPRRGTWDRGFAYELLTSALPTSESDSSSSPELLPTPAAHDDGKTPEQHRQMKANLAGGPRTRITSLAVLARADFEQPEEPLLPTPGANDSTGPEGETRSRRQAETRTGGSALRDLVHLLPTPTATDADASGSRNLPGSKAHPGVSLTDAVRFGNSETPRRLLPTPTATDAIRRNRGQGSVSRGGGRSLREATGDGTAPPSSDGWESSDDPLLDQLTIEGV